MQEQEGLLGSSIDSTHQHLLTSSQESRRESKSRLMVAGLDRRFDERFGDGKSVQLSMNLDMKD